MKFKFKNILLLYKRSAYRIYFLSQHGSLRNKRSILVKQERERFKRTHDEHYNTIKEVGRVLLTNGVKFTESYRGRGIDYNKYDFIITVGGDGTFLEASRRATNQVILGVNSAPSQSVGHFCIANSANFEKIFTKIVNGQFRIDYFHRLRIKFARESKTIEALNDVLITHANPAMLCRYYMAIDGKIEEQRSSGIWISTPAGSTGAIRSAGGRIMPKHEKKFQYKPRELYQGIFPRYKLKGGILGTKEKIEVTSIMRRGKIFVDGAHHKYPFDYGGKIIVTLSPKPVQTVEVI